MISLAKKIFLLTMALLLTACVAYPYGGGGVYYGGRSAPNYYGGSGYRPSYYGGGHHHHGGYGGGNYRGGGYGGGYRR